VSAYSIFQFKWSLTPILSDFFGKRK